MEATLEIGEQIANLVQSLAVGNEAHDLGVSCGGGVLGFVAEFLEKFLSGTQADELDVDILIRFEAAKFDELAGEIDNFDWFAHVEDEDFAAGALSGGLENESGGFRDGHEIAGDIGVSDFDWTASGNLLFEDRNDAAGGAQDVAETNGHELGAGRIGGGEGLKINLGKALGCAHHVGGVDRFIGGDKDETFDAELQCEFGKASGAETVVLDGFAGLAFHHGHVLVGRGVENDGGMEAVQDVAHARTVKDIGDEG